MSPGSHYSIDNAVIKSQKVAKFNLITRKKPNVTHTDGLIQLWCHKSTYITINKKKTKTFKVKNFHNKLKYSTYVVI